MQQASREIYWLTKQYIEEEMLVEASTLDWYLKPQVDQTKLSLNDIYERLLVHAKNKGNGGRAIERIFGVESLHGELKDPRWENLRTLLFDFDPREVNEKYTIYSLFASLQEFVPANEEPTNPVYGFCRSITTGAKYLANKEKVFFDYVRGKSGNQRTEDGVEPMVIEIEKEVSGMGQALVMDFLKELGFTRFVKPDVHTIEICCGIKGISRSDDDYRFTVKTLREIADAVDQTPYSLDRMFWLIGSKNFYRPQDKEIRNRLNSEASVKNRRSHFIYWLRERL